LSRKAAIDRRCLVEQQDLGSIEVTTPSASRTRMPVE